MGKQLSVCATLLLLVLPVPSFADAIWKVGTAQSKITPQKSMWMAGYASRTAPADGMETELWAKALLLEDARGHRGLMITLDLVGIGRELSHRICNRLQQNYQFSRSQIAICTSHTHSGPVVGRNLAALHYLALDQEQRKRIEQYTEALIEQIDVLVADAIGELKPSRLQWGSGQATFAVNRRENKPYESVSKVRSNGALRGPVDHDVPVLSVRDPTGKLRAVLFGYACHATTVSFNQWNADYPGYAQLELGKMYPGCMAMFWAGCGGDQNPLPRSSVELAKHYGTELAEAVTRVLSSPMPQVQPNLRTRFQEVEIALRQLPDAAALHLAADSDNRYERARAEILLQQLAEEGAIDDAYAYPVGVWSLGEQVQLILLGGEVVVDYAIRLKAELSDERTWVAAYANDVMAYIPSRRVLREGGYEGGGSNVYYGLPGLWDETIENTIINCVHRLTRNGDVHRAE